MVESLIQLSSHLMDVDLNDQGNAKFTIDHLHQEGSMNNFTANNVFSMDSNDGILSISGETNFEDIFQYTLYIIGTDSGGLRDNCTIIVNIIDINEAPSMFLKALYHVPENTLSYFANSVLNNGMYVASPIIVTDPDMDYEKRTHSLSEVFFSEFDPVAGTNIFYKSPSSSNTSSTFEFNVGLQLPFNYEENTMYKFEIIVKDAGDLSDSGLFVVTIDDENDPPHFHAPPPPLGDSPTAKRCRKLLQEYGICLSARKSSEYGQNIGATILAMDEDEYDDLQFAVIMQQERNAGSDIDPWRNSSPDTKMRLTAFE